MKIASPQIIHKSDAGGVKVNLTNDDQVRNGFKTIMENAKKYGIDVWWPENSLPDVFNYNLIKENDAYTCRKDD